MILTLALLFAADTPKPAPKLSEAQSSAILQAVQESSIASQILEALRRLDAAQKDLAARLAEAQQTCGAPPVRLQNGAIACPDPKPVTPAK